MARTSMSASKAVGLSTGVHIPQLPRRRLGPHTFPNPPLPLPRARPDPSVATTSSSNNIQSHIPVDDDDVDMYDISKTVDPAHMQKRLRGEYEEAVMSSNNHFYAIMLIKYQFCFMCKNGGTILSCEWCRRGVCSECMDNIDVQDIPKDHRFKCPVCYEGTWGQSEPYYVRGFFIAC